MVKSVSSRWFLTAALTLAACLLAYTLGSRSSGVQGPDSGGEHVIDGLSVPADALNLGDLWEEKDFICELPVRNGTSRDIRVADFAVSCGCFTIEPHSFNIGPGEIRGIRLQFDWSRRRSSELGQAERPFAYEITPLLAKGELPRAPGWKVHGVVRSRITSAALNVHFGDAPIVGQAPVTRKVLVTAHIPVRKVIATAEPPVLAVRVDPAPGAFGRYEVTMSPLAHLPPGDFQSLVKIDIVTPHGERLRGTELPVAGSVRPEVRLLPARLLLPPQAVGTTATGVVVVQAPVGAEVAVDQIETDSPDLRVELGPDDVTSGAKTFRVSLRISQPGEQTRQARFALRKSGVEKSVLSVDVSGYGQEVRESPKTQGGERVP